MRNDNIVLFMQQSCVNVGTQLTHSAICCRKLRLFEHHLMKTKPR